MKNNKTTKETASEITLQEIINQTGGIQEISSDTLFYIEKTISGINIAEGTNAESIARYVQSQTPEVPQVQNLKKFVVVTGDTAIFDIDLTPYTYYTKIHLKFPTARKFKDVSINITGLKDRPVTLESITMSGLDEGTDFLPILKRGTITFALDNTDYEFPSTIYHFGGFNTGGNPEYIFLHIDYIQLERETYKYIIENGIYGTAELWNLDTPENGTEYQVPYSSLDNSTLILKMDTIPDNNFINSYSTNDYIQGDIKIINNITSTVIMEVYFLTHYISHRLMPVVVGAGFLQKNSTIYNITIRRIEDSYMDSGTATYYRFLGSYIGSAVLPSEEKYIQYTHLKGLLLNNKLFPNGIPTDAGMFQVALFGEYLCKQI